MCLRSTVDARDDSPASEYAVGGSGMISVSNRRAGISVDGPPVELETAD